MLWGEKLKKWTVKLLLSKNKAYLSPKDCSSRDLYLARVVGCGKIENAQKFALDGFEYFNSSKHA